MGLKSQKSISWSKPWRAHVVGKRLKRPARSSNAAAATLRGRHHRWQVVKCLSSVWLAASICIFIATRPPDQTGGRIFLKAPGCLQQGHKREAAVKRSINTLHHSTQRAWENPPLQNKNNNKEGLTVLSYFVCVWDVFYQVHSKMWGIKANMTIHDHLQRKPLLASVVGTFSFVCAVTV